MILKIPVIGRYIVGTSVCLALVIVGAPAWSETPAEHAVALVQRGDLQQIEAYLSQPGVGIDDHPGGVKTLLDYAAEQNRVTVAQYLLDHGARVNTFTQGAEDKIVNRLGISPLGRAAYFNSLDVMTLLLDHGADVNSPKNTESPLICAAYRGNLKAVETLIERGADVNHEYGPYQTASSVAIQEGHLEVTRYLFSHGAAPQPADVTSAANAGSPELVDITLAGHPAQNMLDSALSSAAANGRIDESSRQQMLQSLLAHGAAPDVPQNELPDGVMMRVASADTAAFLLDHGANSSAKLTGFDLAADFVCMQASRDPLPLLRMLVARRFEFGPAETKHRGALECAARAGRVDVVDYLVDHGGDVTSFNSEGLTPVFYARTRKVIEALTRHGANLDQTAREYRPDGTWQPTQKTPLSQALETHQWDTAAMLVSMGADVRTHGSDYLMSVAMSGPEDMLTVLLDAGVNVDAANDLREAALMAAIRKERPSSVQLLLNRGADVNRKNQTGQTALHLAVENGNVEMVKLLLDQGADRSISYGQGVTPLADARTEELWQLLGGRGEVNPADRNSSRDTADCKQAQSATPVETKNSPQPVARDPGEDWPHLDLEGEPLPILISDRSYLRTLSDFDGGYLARVDADSIERIVCEYGELSDRDTVMRPLTEYERLVARAKRDSETTSFESARLFGLRGAEAILEASKRPAAPVPLQFNSDANLLGDAAHLRRDDILAYYLDHGVDPNLRWLDHPTDYVSSKAAEHPTALFMAVQSGSDRSVELLLAHGAQPDGLTSERFPGSGALAEALPHRSPSIVEALLIHGANPDIPSGVDEWIRGIFVNSQRPPYDLISTATVLFRHGANPDRWIEAVSSALGIWLQQVSTISLPMDNRATGAPPDPDYGRKMADALRASYPPISDLLDVALRYREAVHCDASTPREQLQYCLPQSLRSAAADLNDRYALVLNGAKGLRGDAPRGDQDTWLRHRDAVCGVREIAGVTEAGWLAYVLSDTAKAQCVLEQTRARARALQSQ